MEKKEKRSIETSDTGGAKGKFWKINEKFPELILSSTYSFSLLGQDQPAELVLYSLNHKYPGWQKVILSNPVLYKNLRSSSVYHAIPSHQEPSAVPVLTSFPILFDYPSHLWTDSPTLRSLNFSDLLQSIPLTIYASPIFDGKYLLISYSASLGSWVLLYGSRQLVLVTRKGACVHPQSGGKSKETIGLQAAVKMWNQVLANMKLNKVLPDAEKEFQDYTLVFECTGSKHGPEIFAPASDDDEYRLVAVQHNALRKGDPRAQSAVSYEEYVRLVSVYKFHAKKRVAVRKDIKDVAEVNKTLADLVRTSRDDVRGSLVTIESGKDSTKCVVTVVSVVAVHYVLCTTVKELLVSYMTHKTSPASKPILLPDEYVEKTLDQQLVLLATALDPDSAKPGPTIEGRKLVRHYVEVAKKCVEMLEKSTMDVRIFKDTFPKFFRSVLDSLAHLPAPVLAKPNPAPASSDSAAPLGYHLMVFAPKGYITEWLVEQINSKYRFDLWEKLEELEKARGAKKHVYYVQQLPAAESLCAYLRTHICRVIVYGYEEDMAEIRQLQEKCLCPGFAAVSRMAEKGHEGEELFELIRVGVKILKKASSITKAQTQETAAKDKPDKTETVPPARSEPPKKPQSEEEEKKAAVATTKPTHKEKDVLLVAFMGLPGVGKTHLIECIRERYAKLEAEKTFNLDVVSSDEIKRSCIQTYMKQHPKESYDSAFQKTLKIAKQTYNEQLRKSSPKANPEDRTRAELASGTPQPRHHHGQEPPALHHHNESQVCPRLILQYSCVMESCARGISVRNLAVIPYLEPKSAISDAEEHKEYPFSYELVLSCYKRLCERKQHLTMTASYSKEKIAEILFTFVKLYENFQFSLPSLRKHGFQYILPIDFASKVDAGVTEKLKALSLDILRCTTGNGCGQKSLLQDFTAMFEEEYAAAVHDPAEHKTEEIDRTMLCIKTIFEKLAMEPAEKTSMKKMPKFVGAEFRVGDYEKIYNMLSAELAKIRTQCFPTVKAGEHELDAIISLINERSMHQSKGDWRVPETWHVTSYFIGKKTAVPDSDYLKKYIEGMDVNVRCDILLYVPGKIVMSILSSPELRLHHSIKVPSVVWLVDEASVSLGRSVCEQLFESYQGLGNLHLTGFFHDPTGLFCQTHKVTISKETCDCVVLKTVPKAFLVAETKFFYK